jgi:hypothetical protein
MSLCLLSRILRACLLGTKFLCVHLKQLSQASSANDPSKDIAHCASIIKDNVDLKLFF